MKALRYQVISCQAMHRGMAILEPDYRLRSRDSSRATQMSSAHQFCT